MISCLTFLSNHWQKSGRRLCIIVGLSSYAFRSVSTCLLCFAALFLDIFHLEFSCLLEELFNHYAVQLLIPKSIFSDITITTTAPCVCVWFISLYPFIFSIYVSLEMVSGGFLCSLYSWFKNIPYFIFFFSLAYSISSNGCLKDFQTRHLTLNFIIPFPISVHGNSIFIAAQVKISMLFLIPFSPYISPNLLWNYAALHSK